MSRPAIPRQLKRDVLIEAGHRCALPSCHQTPVEIAHIIPWETVKEHTFDNLIALCPTCHTRYDNHDIDRQSMLQYKANLSVLNSRYSDLEKRVLLIFARSPRQDEIWLDKWSDIHLMYLLEDGLLEKDPKHRAAIRVTLYLTASLKKVGSSSRSGSEQRNWNKATLVYGCHGS